MPRPAARLTDHHVCQKPAHVGGPLFSPGEPSVLIGNLPAARFSDMATCTGVPDIDAISMGAPTVVIGKLLACRLGEATEHQGVVIGSFPRVLLGDPPPSVTVVRRGRMLIVVNREAHTIMIVGVQEFHGDGASDEYVKNATESINAAWSGFTSFEGETYAVDCMVTGRKTGAPPNPLSNQINVKKTNDPNSVTSDQDPSNQMPYGNGEGYQHSTDNDDGTLTSAHEFGHAMGLPDEYVELPKDATGHRQIKHTGPDGGLMGHVEPGSRPTPDNFAGLITGKGLL